MGFLDPPALTKPVADKRYITVGKQWINANSNSVANITADGSTDDGAAWNSILNSITAPGVDIFFEGISTFQSMPSWKTGVGLHGKGWGKSVLKPGVSCTTAPIQLGGSLGSQIKDVMFKDFEIDGSSLSTSNPVKGTFLLYLKRARFEGVYIHDVTATCFGNDFGDEVFYVNCLAENAGRGQATSALGCSGFGFGMGAQAVEAVKVINCISRGATRNGFLLEYQSGTSSFLSQGYELIGCHAEANQYGINECGGQYTQIIGCTALSNTNHGIWIAPGNNGCIGVGTRVKDCNVTSNGGSGIIVDESSDGAVAPPFYGRYGIDGNLSVGNTSTGIKFSLSQNQTHIQVTGNQVISNTALGIDFGGGALFDSTVSDNHVVNNSQQGIRILTSATRLKVSGNRSGNSAGGSSTSYGLELTSGHTFTDCQIEGNNLLNCATAGLNPTMGTIAGTTVITRNLGYNPVGTSSVTVTASPMTYTAGPAPETLFFIGGTMNPIQVNGITVFNWGVNGGTFTLPVNAHDSVVITYTVAPLALKSSKQ